MEDNVEKIHNLEHFQFHTERMIEERKISDKKYAPMLAYTIIIGLCTIVLSSVAIAIVALVVRAQ